MKVKKIILLASVVISLTTSCSNSESTDSAGNSTNQVVIDNDTCKNIDKYLTRLALDKNFSGGLLIIKDGKKIFSAAVGKSVAAAWASTSGTAETKATNSKINYRYNG